MTLARVPLLESTWKPIVLVSLLLASKVRYLLALFFHRVNTTESKKHKGLRIETSPKAFSSVSSCMFFFCIVCRRVREHVFLGLR